MEEDYQLVTVEEMRDILKERGELDEYYPGHFLSLDEETGLYYTDYFTRELPELVHSHLLVEQMMQDPDKVDWARVTGGYRNFLIASIEDDYQNPLVWIKELPGEIRESMVVVGKVAVRKPFESRRGDSFFHDLFYNVRPLWFADNLPLADQYIEYLDSKYKGMTAWNFLWEEKKRWDEISQNEDFSIMPDMFHWHIGYIERYRGEAKAAEIVRKFREDWPDIVAMKLFGISRMSEQQVEEFRQALFEGMDRNMRRWEAEVAKKAEKVGESNESFSLLTDECHVEKKEAKVISELRAACKGTAVGLWKVIRENEALGYLGTRDLEASVIYRAFTEYFGKLPYTERNFRDARGKV